MATLAELWDSSDTGLKGDLNDRLEQAKEAYRKQFGKELPITSGFRTYEQQAALASKPNKYPVAKPGTSAHETGDAIDLDPSVPNEFLAKHGLYRPFANDPVHVQVMPSAKGTQSLASLWDQIDVGDQQESNTQESKQAKKSVLQQVFDTKKELGQRTAGALDTLLNIVPQTVQGATYASARAAQRSPEEATKFSQQMASYFQPKIGEIIGAQNTEAYQHPLGTTVGKIAQDLGSTIKEYATQYGLTPTQISQKLSEKGINMPASDISNMANTLGIGFAPEAQSVAAKGLKTATAPLKEAYQSAKKLKQEALINAKNIEPKIAAPIVGETNTTPLHENINKAPLEREIQVIEENPTQKPVDQNEVNAKKELLARVGLKNVRTSALEGNHKESSSQFITSQASQEPYGAGMTEQINSEKEALNKHLQNIENESGGHVVRHGTSFQEGDKIQIGKTIKNDLQSGYDNHLAEGKRLYEAADLAQGGKPVEINQFNDFLKKKQNFVYENEKNLQSGIKSYLEQSDLLDSNGNIKPLTVKEAEGLRQYINSKYHYETSALGGQLKGLIDKDVFEQVGGETYQQARKHWGIGKETYENPKAVGDLLSDKGVNQKISDEQVMTKVLRLDQSQFNHLFDTLKADNKKSSINQIKTSLVNEIRTAGQSAVNQPWNSVAAGKEAARLSEKLKVAFADDPEGLAKVMDGIDAGNVLHIPPKYPGAAVQTHLLKNKFSEMALQRLGTTLGASGGAYLAGPIGAAVGGAGGEKIGSQVAQSSRAKRQIGQLNKEIQSTKLSDIGK